MALKYKVITTYKPGQGKGGEQISFPKLTGSSQVNLREVAGILAERSTASEADVYLVMMGLVDLIPELLGDGKTVKLERFGTFRLHARVSTENSPQEVTRKNIREIRLSFKPDNEMKKAWKKLEIKKVSSRESDV